VCASALHTALPKATALLSAQDGVERTGVTESKTPRPFDRSTGCACQRTVLLAAERSGAAVVRDDHGDQVNSRRLSLGHSLSHCQGASGAIDFYKRAFGAIELMRMSSPDGRIGHAEIRIGDSAIMLADEHPEMGRRSPQSLGGAGVNLMIYVDRVDEVFKRAVASGAKELQPIKDQFYGDRSGTLQDPFGHTWTIATHIEDIAPDEMRRRAEKFMQSANA
jgi:PhnB protein